MKKIISHASGLDARFEDELAAAVPEWRDVPPTFSAEEIRHNGSANRFELEIEGQLAVAEYRMEGDRMVLTHTFVPLELRGRKIAERLVTAALKHARLCRFQVVPACSYVETFLLRHPEFADLRAR